MLPSLVSLDHFRSRVYRRRIALLLLLVLLGLQDSRLEDTQRPRSASLRGPAQQQQESTRDRQDGSTTPGPVADLINWAVGRPYEDDLSQNFAHLGNQAPGSGHAFDKHDSQEARNTAADARWPQRLFDAMWPFTPFRAYLSTTSSQTPPTVPSPTPSSPAPQRSFSATTLLLPNIFPTLVQLHGLWALRFLAGEMEGRLSTKRRAIPFGPTLFAVFLLTVSLVQLLLPSTRSLLQAWSSPTTAEARVASATYRPSTFPAGFVLLLEAIPTCLSLGPILLMLFPSVVPKNLHVPSPSHAPSWLEVLPSWVRAFVQPSERARARQAAIASTRVRRHGALGAAPPQTLPPSDFTIDAVSSRRPEPVEAPTETTGTSGVHGGSATRLDPRSRLLRLQQDLIDEMETAGKLDSSMSKAARTKVEATAASDAAAAASGKALRKRDQVVSLPATYVTSLCLMVSSSISLVACYTAVTLRLSNLAPTNVSAIIVLLALRAEIGTLSRDWSFERRRIEGLEFVRRRWGASSPCASSEASVGEELRTPGLCAICLEDIDWSSNDEDAVRLDCRHELHAPCLVPWLMSQAFCPVCHKALRPAARGRNERSSPVALSRASAPPAELIATEPST
ncbi:unnamed protein product [Parajaminaea phylloscopi]